MKLRNRLIWSVVPLAVGALAFNNAAEAGQRHHHYDDRKAPAPVVRLSQDAAPALIPGPEAGPAVTMPVAENPAEAELAHSAQSSAAAEPAAEVQRGTAPEPAPEAEQATVAAPATSSEVAYTQTAVLPSSEVSEAKIPAPVVTVPVGTNMAGALTPYSNGPLVAVP